MRKFRRQGIGKQVAHRLFEKHKGVWEVKQTNENTPAYAFWKKVISEVAKESFYQEEILEGDLWDGAVLVFQYNNKKNIRRFINRRGKYGTFLYFIRTNQSFLFIYDRVY